MNTLFVDSFEDENNIVKSGELHSWKYRTADFQIVSVSEIWVLAQFVIKYGPKIVSCP